jgi:TPR repeat protein
MQTGKKKAVFATVAVVLIVAAWGLYRWAAPARSDAHASTPAAQARQDASVLQGAASRPKVTAKAAKDSKGANPLSMYRDINGSEFDIPKDNYVSVIPDLRARAEQGSAIDAYVLSRILVDCYLVNRGKESGYGAHDGAAPGRCANVDVKDSSEIRKWLAFAAEQGLLAAQLMYSPAVSLVMSQAEMLKDPSIVSDYKNNSMNFLQQAAANGSVEAMMGLASDYHDGIMMDQNIVLAYAYRYAAIDASGNNLMDPVNVWGDLPANMLEEAKAIGKNIAKGN